MDDFPFRRVCFSPASLNALPKAVRNAAVAESGAPHKTDAVRSLVVASASEILGPSAWTPPDWIDAETSYLIKADIPESALFQIPTRLRVHKPDQRIHVTRDEGAAKRQAIALRRDHPFEGVVDAYSLWRDIYVVLGDLTIRCFPSGMIEGLASLSDAELAAFEIHPSGSYVTWKAAGITMGPSQLLQAVDPMFVADVVIERYAIEQVSRALRLIRESKGLKQTDVDGLSDRQVRRLEKEESRLTSDAASRYAEAIGCSLEDFLAELGRWVVHLGTTGGVEAEGSN